MHEEQIFHAHDPEWAIAGMQLCCSSCICIVGVRHIFCDDVLMHAAGQLAGGSTRNRL